MATTLTATLQARFASSFVKTTDLSAGTKDPIDSTRTCAFTNGTTSGKVDKLWHDQRTAAASADTIDLAAALTDVHGTSVTFAKLRGIFIENLSTTSGQTLKIGGGSNPLATLWGAAGDIFVLGPSTTTLPAFFAVTNPQDGYTVTPNTGDILQIDPGANTITYNIWIVGTSA